MKRLLGLSTVGNFKDGCMQDVHWPAGLFGYFPTYTLGALTAAQLFEAAKTACPGIPAAIERGDLSELDAWLTENVWGVRSSGTCAGGTWARTEARELRNSGSTSRPDVFAIA